MAALRWADKVTKNSNAVSVFSLSPDGILRAGALERKIAAAIKAAAKINFDKFGVLQKKRKK